MTFIPALAVQLKSMRSEGKYLLKRAGYFIEPPFDIVLTHLQTGKSAVNAFGWDISCRTMYAAHNYIRENYDNLKSGQVIDIEFIAGETTKPKVSERLTHKEEY